MHDSYETYFKPRILKDFLMKDLEKIKLFSLRDHRGLYYYASELHQLDVDPYGSSYGHHFYSINTFLSLINYEELEKWKITGIHKSTITDYVEIYIERIFSDIKVDHYCTDKIQKITLNGPATIIFWDDGTKTVVKCDSEDEFDKEKGILYAALKKLSTNKTYNDILRAIDLTKDPFVEGVIFCEGK